MKKTIILSLIMLIVLQIIFLWNMDVAVGAIWRANTMTNGLHNYDPMVIYHICLWGIIVITVLFVMLVVQIHKKEEKQDAGKDMRQLKPSDSRTN